MTTIHNMVLETLKESERARGDDFYLWYLICSAMCEEAMWQQFQYVLVHHNEFGVPSFESVRRARQKIQATYPELKNDYVAERRHAKEQVYLDYARSDI